MTSGSEKQEDDSGCWLCAVPARYGRFALHRDRVYVQLAVAAKPFVPAHLHQALRVVSQIADGIDDELAAKLGGRTTFPV